MANGISVNDGLARDDATTAGDRYGFSGGAHLFGLPEQHMLAAEAAILLELQPVRRVPLVLGGGIAHFFTIRALEQNLVSHETGFLSGVSNTQACIRLFRGGAPARRPKKEELSIMDGAGKFKSSGRNFRSSSLPGFPQNPRQSTEYQHVAVSLHSRQSSVRDGCHGYPKVTQASFCDYPISDVF